MKSVPGSADDPCKGAAGLEACAAGGGMAVSTCVGGQWSLMCACERPGGQTGTPSAGGPNAPSQPVCGNGVREMGEVCESNDLNGANCQTLGFMGGGVLMCNRSTCNYDTLMCRMSSGAAGGGAGMSGGAGTSGGAGSGN